MREVIATRAPSARNIAAQASPIPYDPPVTRTVFPLKPSSMSLSVDGGSHN